MTDSMKFGPEWLRNLATDMTNNQSSSGGGGGGGSSCASSASSTNSSNNGPSNNYQSGPILHQPQLGSQFYVRNLFPEFRYGREEMLSLFDKNCTMPEILPSFKKLFIGKAQYPLALTPNTEEETFSTVSQPPTQRPQWLQRSPVTFNSVPRGGNRGGSVDRGRMRGKSVYHPIFPRPTPMFEDDARSIKPERGWSERNGGPGENSSVGVPDWSTSPSSSPRKDFSVHPARIPENWRRSRLDEDGAPSSGPPGGGNANSGLSGGIANTGVTTGGDGWRGSSSNNFGSNRWGRSTSWREDDGGNGSAESNSYIIPPMQRSYSTIATTERNYFSLSKSSSLTSAVAGGLGGASSGGGGNTENTNKPQISSNSRHHHQNSGNHLWDTEDILPEWATENPTDSGGTFDASGAFHGSMNENEEKRKAGSASSSTASSTSSSKTQNVSATQCGDIQRHQSRNAFKGEEKLSVDKDQMNLNDEDPGLNEDKQRKTNQLHPQTNVQLENVVKTTEKLASCSKIDHDTSDQQPTNAAPMSSSSPSQLATPTISTSTSASTMTIMMQPSHKIPLTELSDHMQEVADDMVEKLIMDDDNIAHSGQKSTGATPNSVASVAGATGKLPTTVAPLQAASNAAKVSAIFKNQSNKGVFLPVPVVDPILQQHIQQQAAAVVAVGSGAPPPGTRMLPPPIPKQNELWYYRDPQSKVQGPFNAIEMIEWYRAGYFDENLYVRRMCDSRFAALGELIKICGQMPFQSSHLIPPLQPTEIPSITNPLPIPITMAPHDSCHQVTDAANSGIVNTPNICIGDLKGSATATADALGVALKNAMSPVDVSHILNAHFQMLQEQYLRHQEMLVLAEFSAKDSFNRLTPSEKAALVRQKVHIMGLPEHLTSLAGLSNSLATLNPSAGNHLCEVIAECSKKDSYGMTPLETQLQQFQQHLQHQNQQKHHQQQVQQQQALHQQAQQVQQQSQNPFMKPEDFRQQHQQQASVYQSVPYRSLFSQVDGTGSNAPGEENLNSDILNELNLHMLLHQNRLRTGREQASLPPQVAASQNDFGPELLPRAPPQIMAATVVNMMPQWPPHILPHGQLPQQPSQQNPQVPPTTPNQWPLIPGPVVVTPMQSSVPKSSSSMWAAADSSSQILMPQHQQQAESLQPKVDGSFVSRQLHPQTQPQHQAQSQQQIIHQDTNNSNVEKVKEDVIETKIDNSISFLTTNKSMASTEPANAQLPLANRNKGEKLLPIDSNVALPNISTTKPSGSSATETNSGSNISSLHVNVNNNKRNGKNKPTDKPADASKNKPNQHQPTQAVAGPTEEERRKEAAEEKRKQKEEKKRQQLEDEKKRLQLAEEEKRRQAFEEKERQKEIQAHRRKAMLNSANGGYPSVMGSNGKIINSASGSTLSKQERMQTSIAPWSTNTQATVASAPGPSLAEIQKAERRERRADQRLMEQTEKRIAAAAEATDNVLKWNPAPVQVKSLAEIQAEEAKRFATEQAASTEMQRRKEQEQTTSVAANNLSSNPFATIWSGSKVWGTNNSTSGFWDESVKFSNAAGAASTNSSITAKPSGQTYGASGNNTTSTSKQSASTPSSGNASSSAAPGGHRNLTKTQNLSNMVGVSSWNNVNLTSNAGQSKSQQQVSSLKQQSGSNALDNNVNNNNKGKKGNRSIAGASNAINSSLTNLIPSAGVTTNNVNKNDDFRNEFTGWCMKSLNSMSPKVDVPTFVTFLQDLESPYEVKDYIRMYLGESKEYTEFAKQFLERRSKYKNLQRAQNAHIDDMCKPAPAINPSGNDSFDNKGKPKKVKKSKMTRLDARILGFSVTAAEGRINVGDRDYGDAP